MWLRLVWSAYSWGAPENVGTELGFSDGAMQSRELANAGTGFLGILNRCLSAQAAHQQGLY